MRHRGGSITEGLKHCKRKHCRRAE